jgi:DegV family protein with EDD domain
MTYKIIADSSSNLRPGFLKGTGIGFDVAPLTVRVGDKDYVDDGSSDNDEMLAGVHNLRMKDSSSCPSPNDFLSRMTGADKYILLTISSKLSGSYNSAMLARTLYANPENVIAIDSLSTAGNIEQLVLKAVSLIQKGENLLDIEKDLNTYRNDIHILFILDHFDSFIKNGRINKILAFIAERLHIKPICYGDNGEIKVREKVRRMDVALQRLVTDISEMTKITEGKNCIISHTKNLRDALTVKALIQKAYSFSDVIIRENQTLCSYYSLNGGILVCF